MTTLKTIPRNPGENFITYLLRTNDEHDLIKRGWNVQEMKEYSKHEETIKDVKEYGRKR